MNIPKLTLSEEQVEAIVREELAMREELRAGEIKYPAGQAPQKAGADEYRGLETGMAIGAGKKNIVRVPVKPGMGKPEQAAAKAASIKSALKSTAAVDPAEKALSAEFGPGRTGAALRQAAADRLRPQVPPTSIRRPGTPSSIGQLASPLDPVLGAFGADLDRAMGIEPLTDKSLLDKQAPPQNVAQNITREQVEAIVREELAALIR